MMLWLWFIQSKTFRYTRNAIQLIMDCLAIPTQTKHKLVVLTHAKEHGPSYGQFWQENFDIFVEFLRLAKLIGYTFRTIDTYVEDVVPDSW